MAAVRQQQRCPRCGATLRPPGLWQSEWTCSRHGAVHPFAPVHPPTTAWLQDVARRSQVPVWCPWPVPAGWLLSGVAEVGSERSGPQATVVAMSGPNPALAPDRPAPGPADMLLVAEAPGIGLGAHLAGLDGVDPGDAVAAGPAHATVDADGHASSLWHVVGAEDRAVYVGEAGGVWLYVLLWPATAGVLLAESLSLTDVRGAPAVVSPPCGALTSRLG